MFELKGKYNDCKVFTDNVDETCIGQLITLLNQESLQDSIIRIMPDAHAGAGCVIGTTMTITDKVIPNLVGVDIGCGMYTVKLKEKRIMFILQTHNMPKYRRYFSIFSSCSTMVWIE